VTKIKHRYLDVIHTQLHNRFKEGKCMELFILEGEAERIRELAAELQRSEENEYVKLLVI
jgi:CopG family nickel-responsive transcriptional regulator